MIKISIKKELVIKITFLTLLFVTILGISYAADIVPKVTIKAGTQTISAGGDFISLKNGTKFTITASCIDAENVKWSTDSEFMKNAPNGPFMVNDKGMAILKYCIKEVSSSKKIIANVTGDMAFHDPTNGSVTINELKAGSYYALGVIAVGAADGLPLEDGSTLSVSTGWKYYFFQIPSEIKADVEVWKENSKLAENSTTVVKVGDKLTIKGVPAEYTKTIYYIWDNGAEKNVSAKTTTFTIPNATAGSSHTLKVLTEYTDNSYLKAWKTYRFTIEDNGEEEEYPIGLTVKMGSTTLSESGIYTYTTADQLTVSTSSSSKVTKLQYKWGSGAYQTLSGSTISLSSLGEGSTNTLTVNVIYEDGRQLTKVYTIKIEQEVEEEYSISLAVKKGTTTLSESRTYTYTTSDTLSVSVGSSSKVTKLQYKWGSSSYKTLTGSTISLSSLKEGSTNTLTVNVIYEDGRQLTKVYTIKIAEESDPDEYSKTLTLKKGSTSLSESKTYKYESGTILTLVIAPINKVEKIQYAWDDDSYELLDEDEDEIEIPDFDDDSIHELEVKVKFEDGDTLKKVYTFSIPEGEEEDDGDELEIENWMKENDDLDTLAVSLRNDSETSKSNRNMYELDEEVIYYIDYKNGGSKIKTKVTLVLNIPEKFSVVERDGGTVSTSKKTITWTFSSLDEEESGTKKVILKYKSMAKSGATYMFVRPTVEIKKGSSVVDTSGVINLIFKSTSTEIKDQHAPYMYGDKERRTFRPDDGITRAEAALVFTRVFELKSYSTGTQNITYLDLNQTYLEAQNAIKIATAQGLLKGYPDGTFRPNDNITRAEFMTVVARKVAGDNSDEDGFEIKDLESSIKIYKNTAIRNNNEHWAINELTLLARLNMAGLTSKNRNIRPDEIVTRAEVAQLMNLYLFRAPAKVASNEISGFLDVSRMNSLYEDIIEATREIHTYKLTSDGREVAK